jgi:hypothetical protein
VRHGTGFAALDAELSGGIHAHLPVLESDFGRLHGTKSQRIGGVTRDGRSWAVESDGADGPVPATRIYRDGQLVVSSVN